MLVLGLISLNVVASDHKSFIEIFAGYIQQRDGVKPLNHSWISTGCPDKLTPAQSALSQALQMEESQYTYFKNISVVERKSSIAETITE